MCIRVQGRSHRLRREIQPPRNKRPRSNPWALFLFPVTSASQPPPPKEPHVHPLPRLNHRRRHRHCTYPTGRNVSLGHGPVLLAFRNFTGVVKAGELLPVGFCSECRGDVARVVEMAGGALELGRVPKQLSVGAPQMRLNSNRFALSQNFHYGLVRWKGAGQILSEK